MTDENKALLEAIEIYNSEHQKQLDKIFEDLKNEDDKGIYEGTEQQIKLLIDTQNEMIKINSKDMNDEEKIELFKQRIRFDIISRFIASGIKFKNYTPFKNKEWKPNFESNQKTNTTSKANFVTLKFGKDKLNFRISKIDMMDIKFNDIENTTREFDEYDEKCPIILSNEKIPIPSKDFQKLLKWPKQVCNITFYIPKIQEKPIFKDYIVMNSAIILQEIITAGGNISDELMDKINNDKFLKYENGAIFIKSIIDEEE